MKEYLDPTIPALLQAPLPTGKFVAKLRIAKSVNIIKNCISKAEVSEEVEFEVIRSLDALEKEIRYEKR